MAASSDRIAWDRLQRIKKSSENDHEAASSIAVTPLRGIANVSNVSMYDAPGSEDVGMEVEPRGVSFPYGDEKSHNSMSPVRLNAGNAAKWTAEGISLTPAATSNREKPSFSPYGDENRRQGRSLEESWDLDEFPVKDENEPSPYSFLYPLKRRVNDALVPDARRSPNSEDSVHESLEVTSVGTPDFANSDVRGVYNDGEEDSKEESLLAKVTASMVKEVEDIADYLMQY